MISVEIILSYCSEEYLKRQNMFLNFRLFVIILIQYLINLKNFCAFESEDTFDVDINDILSENLMPVSYFLHEEHHYDDNNYNYYSKYNEKSPVSGEFGNTTREHFYESRTLDNDGDFDRAYSTMGFHR